MRKEYLHEKAGWPNTKIDPETYMIIKIMAAKEDRRVNDVVEELLTTDRHVEKK